MRSECGGTMSRVVSIGIEAKQALSVNQRWGRNSL